MEERFCREEMLGYGYGYEGIMVWYALYNC
jgi:hypothetical protein